MANSICLMRRGANKALCGHVILWMDEDARMFNYLSVHNTAS